MARARCRQATARSVARTAVPFFLVLGLAVVAVTAQKKPKPKPLLSLYRSKLVPKMYNLETCADKANSFRIANLSVGLGRFGGEVYDLDLHVLRTAQQISQVKLAVQRCTGAVSPAMCEKFNTWIFTNSICDMMVAKHMAWSPMMQFINPPFKCPMEAGVYAIRNGSMDLDLVDKALPGNSLDKFIWLTDVQLFDEARALFGCFKWVLEARRVRIKDDGILG
ncbi:uncharacterized protein LOC117650547 isoform X2 [Thrips palmi]|uniref:Uncharacterized protein LOC117650547 isoform X2 n=1 Tax=Thrips palmi TaxID=161013 RepID=A0A6P8ZYW3_THRPL|nr:uncharacterized protein LOC117650547 isoform X2 [Thrips palmi]